MRSPLLLGLVLGVHALNAWLASRRLGLRGDDAYWGVLLGVFLQLGSLATLLSLFHALSAGPWLGSTLALAVASVVFLRPVPGEPTPSPQTPRRRFAAAQGLFVVLGLLPIAFLLGGAAVVQLGTPLHKGDDFMYHGSRVLYWLNFGSLLPFETHNDRQNVFPFAELVFLLGALFTRSECAARALHFVAFLSAFGASTGSRGRCASARTSR